MRNGTRVPALAAGATAVSALEKYKKTEIVTALQFSETQAQAVINNGDAIADSGANYMRVARTTSETVGDYSTDTAAAFYWVDDIQLLAAAEGRTPAALVSFTPDPWLTDFFAPEASPTVRGRLAQTTFENSLIINEVRTCNIRQVGIDPTKKTEYFDGGACPERFYPASNLDKFRVLATYASENGEIFGFMTHIDKLKHDILDVALDMSRVAKVHQGDAVAVPQDFALSPLKIYILPSYWCEGLENETDTDFDLFFGGGLSVGTAGISVRRIKAGTAPDPPFEISLARRRFDPKRQRAFIGTPKRIVEVQTCPSGLSNDHVTFGGIFVQYSNGSMSDALQITMYINGEFQDISDDFTIDFAVNEASLRQAQQKEFFALNAISNVVGAVGGAVGGFASGNYFGAIQSIVGGVQGLMQPAAERRQPATLRGDGNVAIAVTTEGILQGWIVSNETNTESIDAYISEYGYTLENAPFVEFSDIAINNFYMFAAVDIVGTTGGQLSQLEIADAFRRGVRLVEL